MRKPKSKPEIAVFFFGATLRLSQGFSLYCRTLLARLSQPSRRVIAGSSPGYRTLLAPVIAVFSPLQEVDSALKKTRGPQENKKTRAFHPARREGSSLPCFILCFIPLIHELPERTKPQPAQPRGECEERNTEDQFRNSKLGDLAHPPQGHLYRETERENPGP